nr:transposase [Streptomyces sp. NRRL B-24484]
MQELVQASKEWLTVFQLPSYAPDLNPQEGIWSLVKRTIGNLAAANLDQLARAVKRSLKQIQYRPHLIDGCLADTGLITDGWPSPGPTSRIQVQYWPGSAHGIGASPWSGLTAATPAAWSTSPATPGGSR